MGLVFGNANWMHEQYFISRLKLVQHIFSQFALSFKPCLFLPLKPGPKAGGKPIWAA
jgi:hypothetical protein